MTIGQLLLSLRARPWIFAIIVALTVLSTTIVTLLLPKTYVATASLLVDNRDEQQSMSSGNGNYVPPRMQTGYLQTQMDLITSHRVARKVVRDLDLTRDRAAREAFIAETDGAGSFEDWLAKSLLKKLKVDSSQSSVMQIIYKARDAHSAALIANEFAKAYIATALELRVEPSRQTAAWFDEQVKGLRARLEEAQAKLTKFQREKGIIATDERLDVENARLAELSTQLVQVQNLTYAAGTKERMARSLGDIGVRREEVPEVLASTFIQALKTDLLRGEAKMQELSTQLGVNHPQYQRQQSENRSLRQRIDAETRKIVDGLANAARQTRQHEAELKSALTAQRARVLEVKQHRSEAGVLIRDVETAQKAYDNAMQRLMVSKVESGATRTNLSVLDPAVEPNRPAQPRVALNIALSVVVGTLLAMGVVFLMERANRRVRALEDLETGFDVPLIAQLNPWQPAPRLLERARTRGWALPAPR
jgi:chain length determinant protein EpsF